MSFVTSEVPRDLPCRQLILSLERRIRRRQSGWLLCRVLRPTLGNGVPTDATTLTLGTERPMLRHSPATAPTAMATPLTATVAAIAASLVATAAFRTIVIRFGISVAPTIAIPPFLCRAILGDVANHVTNVTFPRVHCHIWHPRTKENPNSKISQESSEQAEK